MTLSTGSSQEIDRVVNGQRDQRDTDLEFIAQGSRGVQAARNYRQFFALVCVSCGAEVELVAQGEGSVTDLPDHNCPAA